MLEVIQMFSLLLTVVSYARHLLAGIFYARKQGSYCEIPQSQTRSAGCRAKTPLQPRETHCNQYIPPVEMSTVINPSTRLNPINRRTCARLSPAPGQASVRTSLHSLL